MIQDSDSFSHNVQLWAKHDPKKALLLPFHDAGDLVRTEEGNLRSSSGECFYGEHPREEAKQRCSHWELSSYGVLFVYGVGLGYDYAALLPWLRESSDRLVIFLEDDLSVIYHLLHTELGTDLVSNPQVRLHYLDTLQESQTLFDTLYWDFVGQEITVFATQFYEKTKGALFAELKSKIYYDKAMKEMLVGEYLNYGAVFFKNYYPNLLQLHRSYLGNRLFGSFSGVPAIICGAGPSLEKQIPLLKTLSDRALVFSGGAALNALNHSGFQPHFSGGIDPNLLQLDRLQKNRAFTLPFFYRNRMHHEAFTEIHGPRLYITGSGGYDVAEWFEEQLGIKEELIEEGGGVIYLLLEIAHAMGCSPIIFVGMDLAYTQGKTYAPGIDAKVNVEKADDVAPYDFDKVLIEREGIDGNPVETTWKWISEAEEIGKWAEAHPGKGLYNATEGGLGFPGVPNMTLEEISQRFLREERDLPAAVHAAIQASALPDVTEERVLSLVREWRESLVRCQEHLKCLDEEASALLERMEQGKELPPTLQTGRAALSEVELAEEPGYTHLLDIFNGVITRFLQREQRLVLAEETEEQKNRGKILLNQKRFRFLHNVVTANLVMVDRVLPNE